MKFSLTRPIFFDPALKHQRKPADRSFLNSVIFQERAELSIPKRSALTNSILTSRNILPSQAYSKIFYQGIVLVQVQVYFKLLLLYYITTMADFTPIREIEYRFDRHPTKNDAKYFMNYLFGGRLLDLAALFTDDTRSTVVPDALRVIRAQVGDVIILNASETTDAARIRHVVNVFTFKVFIDEADQGFLRTTAQLTEWLQDAMDNGHDSIMLDIGIMQMHFHPTAQINFLNWTYISATEFPGGQTAGIPTLAEFSREMLNAVSNITVNVPPMPNPATSSSGTGTTAPTVTGGPGYTFNTAGLPPDVSDRYTKHENGSILRRSELIPYTTGGKYYYEHGTERLFLVDGTCFVTDVMDKKEFLRNPPCCKEEINPSNIAGLYTMLEKHGLENNVYVHPFFAFRRGVDDPRGFSIGSDPDDDLPERFRIPVGKMATLIHKLLRDKNVFAKPTDDITDAIASTNDGYVALKTIIMDSHPAFVAQPATLVTSYPRQTTKETLTHYFQRFKVYLQTQAYVLDSANSFDDATTIDIFINGTFHALYLNRKSFDERQDPLTRNKYTHNRIIETLRVLLTLPDSPTQKRQGFYSATSRSYTPQQWSNSQYRPQSRSTQRSNIPTEDD